MSFDGQVHEHDDEDDDAGEIEVNIDPRDEKLDALGINRDEFEEALLDALDAYNDELESDTDDMARPLEEVTLTIRGATHRLGDLAEISVEAEDSEDEDEAD